MLFLPFNQSGGVFFIYAAAFAAEIGKPSRAAGIIATLVVICAVEALVMQMALHQWIWAVVFSVLIGAINIHYEQVRRGNWKIRLAQGEIERLARIAERERIARDLHDLLGHTLSVIILKSELASKLAEKNPERSLQEIRDVERISREALSEVRSAVRGYRSAGLRGEIESIRSSMQDAGILVVLDTQEVSLSAELESVLALALREAATNVLRHAGASRCEISLRGTTRSVSLRVQDNGAGASGPEGAGLKGMRERVEAAGGSLKRQTDQGTTIVIELPIERARAPRAEIA
jgi:two-component system sensor histidine kinase DesK